MAKPYKEKEFEYKGFSCTVLFQGHIGYRCGYVGIPKGNKFYESDYDDLDLDFDVHGGLTYADDHVPCEESDGKWYLGFDCAHCDDAEDMECWRKYYKDNKNLMDLLDRREKMHKRLGIIPEGHIWTCEEVEEECKKLVDQIIEKENE